jgi:hypothetical protein
MTSTNHSASQQSAEAQQKNNATSAKCKHMPIIITLAVLTISGLCFGGIELWQNTQKNSEIKSLQTRIKSSSSLKENDPAAEATTKNEDIQYPTDGGKTNKPEYLYIGDWNVKIKIPNELYIYSYEVKSAETTDFTWYTNASNIVVSGFTKQLTTSPQKIPTECYQLLIARVKGKQDHSLAYYDGYSYVVGTDVPCVAEAGYSKEAIDLGGKQLIRKMFSDINNYSEI